MYDIMPYHISKMVRAENDGRRRRRLPTAVHDRAYALRKKAHPRRWANTYLIPKSPIPSQVSLALLPNPKNERQEA